MAPRSPDTEGDFTARNVPVNRQHLPTEYVQPCLESRNLRTQRSRISLGADFQLALLTIWIDQYENGPSCIYPRVEAKRHFSIVTADKFAGDGRRGQKDCVSESGGDE